jgi:hypothetical protein
MERSVIRESLVVAPDFAGLHPGYMLRIAETAAVLRSARETAANEGYRRMPATEGRSRGSR